MLQVASEKGQTRVLAWLTKTVHNAESVRVVWKVGLPEAADHISVTVPGHVYLSDNLVVFPGLHDANPVLERGIGSTT